MNVVDLPQPANHALYDEAVTYYADLVRSRSIAVYRVGEIERPGLSGIDLLVVTSRTGIDNRYYFSALHRLPRRFHRLFEHEPFILPGWSLRVVQYTAHYDPSLLVGRDVLHAYAPLDSRDERWCRMLEGYLTYAAFQSETLESGILHGRRTLKAAGGMRYAHADAAQLLPPFDAQSFAREISALQATFFDRADPASGVLAAWNLFTAAFQRLDTHLRAALNLPQGKEGLAAARDLLRGEEASGAFDREYAFRRARAIDGYHQELASMGFPYGHLFSPAAHPGALQRLPDVRVVSDLVRNLYRVRRRLGEYAGRA